MIHSSIHEVVDEKVWNVIKAEVKHETVGLHVTKEVWLVINDNVPIMTVDDHLRQYLSIFYEKT